MRRNALGSGRLLFAPLGIARSGTVVQRRSHEGPDIPDSAVVQFDAQAAFGAGDDGTTLSEWTDEIGGHTATGGSPTVRSDGINGNVAVEFAGDSLDTGGFTLSQPNTIFAVIDKSDASSGQFVFDSTNDSARNALQWTNAPEWRGYGGTAGVEGSSDETIQLLTGVFDGGSTVLREAGSQTATGDGGSDAMDGITIGAFNQGGTNFDGLIGEILICEERLSSSGISEEESRLANKWGISL